MRERYAVFKALDYDLLHTLPFTEEHLAIMDMVWRKTVIEVLHDEIKKYEMSKH